MEFFRRYRWILLAMGVTALVVAFLAFRPDKIFVDDAVDESLSDAFVTETDVTTSVVTQSAPTSTLVSVTTSAPDETPSSTQPPPSVPTAVVEGQFFGIDHSAEGTATVYQQNGRYVLRFEDDTDIQNGPDLYVWVLEDDDYETGTPARYIDLGKIKGNVGGQNYELPPEYDPELHQFVLIWCLRFSVPFAAAPLA